MSNFPLKPFPVGGETNGKIISGLWGSVPREITQEKAIEEIQIWSENMTDNRTPEEAKKFFQEQCSRVFSPSGVEVKTHEAEIKEG